MSSPSLSQQIMGWFSKTKTKSIPLNPNSTSSDEYDEDEEPSQRRPSVSSSRSGEGSSDKSRLLSRVSDNEALKKERINTVEKYSKKIAKVLASTALSHFAPGTGGVLNLGSVASTANHGANLQQLLDEECPANKPELCKGLLAYVLSQKNEKLGDAVLKCLPVVGTIMMVKDKFHWLDKKVAGVAGRDRLARAKLLVDHANKDKCHIALAIYAEVVCKDSTRKEAWESALRQLEEEPEIWERSDEEPINLAAKKLAGKMKSVS